MLTLTVLGALLGSRENQQVSVVNSFELVLFTEPDVTGEQSSWPVDREFFDTRKAQCECLQAIAALIQLIIQSRKCFLVWRLLGGTQSVASLPSKMLSFRSR
jgi:hypothetical protein